MSRRFITIERYTEASANGDKPAKELTALAIPIDNIIGIKEYNGDKHKCVIDFCTEGFRNMDDDFPTADVRLGILRIVANEGINNLTERLNTIETSNNKPNWL